MQIAARFTAVRYEAGADAVYAEALHKWPTAERVLSQLVPNAMLSWTIGGKNWSVLAERACRQALGVLADLDEVERHMSPPTPQADLTQLHPWVWDAARTFWTPTGYRVAVLQAAAALTAHTQQKTGRFNIADDALMGEVWGDGAASRERPRLRLDGCDGDQTQASRQRGARSLAQGCYWAIRNPAAHQVEEWPEQVALEGLCALSLLARLVDEAAVVTDDE